MEKLPAETLLLIFNLVNPPITHFDSPWASQRLHDLFSLSLVCKIFNPIATGLLYETIEGVSDTHSIDIYRFSRTTRKHPELLQHLKILRFKSFVSDERICHPYWAFENSRFRSFLDEVFFSDIEDISAKGDPSNKSDTYKGIDTLAVDEGLEHKADESQQNDEGEVCDNNFDQNELNLYIAETSWLLNSMKRLASQSKLEDPIELFRSARREEDVLLTSKILQAPNLQYLWYSSRSDLYKCNTHCLLLPCIGYSVLGAIHNKHHAFNKLRVIHIDLASSGFRFPLIHALPLLLLECLEELTLAGWGKGDFFAKDDSTVFGRPWEWPLRASSIARLSLLRPDACTTMIAKMILACKALSRFELAGHLIDDYIYDGKSRYDLIGSALCEQADSLTEISTGGPFDDIQRLDISGSFHSAVTMTKLTSIRCPLETLMRHMEHSSLCDAIPPSIEHLWLELPGDIPDDLDPHFLDIYQRSLQGHFPHLRSIKLSWVSAVEPKYQGLNLDLLFDLIHLRVLFKTSSISFDLEIFCCFEEELTPKEYQELCDTFTGEVTYWTHPEEGSVQMIRASTCALRPLKDFQEDERNGY
ncbi:hypothetical protein IQ07DRAFT_644051 [Pyrenochaeta sp. DS3sAY3a]|nr:hypothetical protein IQ07DRAFT_644051 [Pyrenochaeta sp. DS3sAY3a]